MTYVYRAFHIESCSARNLHSLSGMFTEQLAAPFRNLIRMQIVFAKHTRPIRDQNAMRGACNRIFRYADSRREEARYEVAAISSCCNNDPSALDLI